MTRLIRKQSVISAKLDGDLVLLSLERDMYFGSKSVGAMIWELLEVPRTVEEIVGILQASFDVDTDQCLEDVRSFLNALVSAELVEWSS
ncbi:MAG: PqqD family protein [Xanthomonadales bacterium PRO6]|nr:MAG: PqqD family protein [Armatimonadota bacterium]MBV6413077.1 hypothetical protein [Xanthomonadales bacterium]MCE7930750.1 PqqD family protein [Xanthomonadales bacterium PRO6]